MTDDVKALRARIAKMEDELAHEKGGRLDEAAIRAACEQETGAWPYGRIIDAVVSTLRAQQARWEAFVEAEAERAEKAEARVAELERERREVPGGQAMSAKREKIGHRLKRVRIARDLSLRETASKVGVSPTYLSRVENCLDPSPPTEKTLRALADVLGDNFDELMQLAGRVPEDVEKLIKADPDMPVMLRRAREQNVTGAEFLEWLETKKKGGK